jgi:ABC-type thiamin/hydroxymethylpyrimidine transport system permease subunit
MKFFWQTDITGNPFFLITILFVLISVIFLLMGIQSEVLIRIYHQQGKEKQYYIKQTKNIQKKAKYSPDDL